MDATFIPTAKVRRDNLSQGVTQECFDELNYLALVRKTTMNGMQARISGRQNKFANVWSHECPDGIEFAWETVAHIINTATEFEC